MRKLQHLLYKYLPDSEEYLFKDLSRTVSLLRTREYYLQNPNESYNPKVTSKFYDEAESSTLLFDWDTFSRRELTNQVRTLFHHLHDNEGIPDEAISIRESVKHRFIVKESSIPNAGNGVFLRSSQRILPGTVLGFYPGVVHLRGILGDKEYFRSILPDPDMLLARRTDGALIDGRTADQFQNNRYAVAHLLNHCGKTPPNVINVTYNFPNHNDPDLRLSAHHWKYIPNSYAYVPKFCEEETKGLKMKGMLMLSCAPIEDGEELLIDYRLYSDPQLLPSWYEHYNSSEAQMRSKLKL